MELEFHHPWYASALSVQYVDKLDLVQTHKEDWENSGEFTADVDVNMSVIQQFEARLRLCL